MRIRFRHFTTAALLAQAAALVPSIAAAAVPPGLNEQGRLFDNTGNPLNATVSLTFSIYADASGGTAVWTETQAAVTLDEGYFSVQLGSVTPIPQSVWTGATMYVGVAVNADPEMTPRQATFSVPYALVSNDAVGAIHPTTVSVNGQVVINANGDWVGPSSGLAGATGPAGANGAPGATGPAGATGVTGPAGANGATGSAGPQGPQGPIGATGAQGGAGTNGADGAAGPQGAQGPAGAAGAAGANGATGAEGATGATGPAGAQGLQGPQGAQGLQGPAGPTGATGAQGPQGATGANGAAGAQGSAGASGSDGATGATGATGAAGASGATGPAGAQGPQGPTGATGAQGSTGAAGAAGAQGPAGANGANGAQGSTGATGASGSDGATGATGATGPAGAAGVQGPTGAQGTAGVTGPQGVVGPQGVAGPAGSNGTNGLNGVVGPTGPQGPTGATGAQGSAGATGAAGAIGATGPQGGVGPQGVAGPAGSNGTNGTNGLNGVAGPTGPQGPSGTAGAQGSAGAAGAAGSNGAQGTTGTAGSNGAQGAAGSNGAQGATGTTGSLGAQGASGTAGTNGAQGATGSNGTNGAQGAAGATGPQGPAGPAGSGGSGSSNYPAAFSFANQTGAPLNTLVSSNAVPVSGFVGPAAATCGGACTAISVNGGAFALPPVTGIQPGDTLAMLQLSSPSANTATQATINLAGTLSTAWTVTTGPAPTYQLSTNGSAPFHNCLIKNSPGAAYCWGYNAFGELGNGGSTEQNTLVPVVMNGLAFASISAASNGTQESTCALTASGAAYCWGYNGNGTIGNNTTAGSSTPIPVSGGLSFSQISTNGWTHTCGVTTSGAGYCWGNNATGQLGTGNTTNYLTPQPVLGGLTFKQILTGMGDEFTCGLTTAGAAYCWGDNGDGELGDGNTTNRSLPVAVSGGLTFVSITIGYYYACGVTPAGAAYCWGDNVEGELGDGNTSYPNSAPIAVLGGLTFSSLVGGNHSTCGLTLGGAAWCWGGENSDGTLGNGTNADEQTTPVQVFGNYDFVQLASGFDGFCGLTASNAVLCWGDNAYGQLGNGTTNNANIPTPVSNLP